MNIFFYKLSFLTVLFLTITGAAEAQVASNPPYTIEQSVMAGGGGTSSGAGSQFSITGSIGQAVTDASGSAPFTIKSGFFTAVAPLAPTAATVTIGGRVSTAAGRGIVNVRVSLTDSQGAVRQATTTESGFYSFSDVQAGETYIITATGKRFTFAQPTQVVNVSDDTQEINFVGTLEKRLRAF